MFRLIVIEVRRTNMRQVITALILTLEMLVCPFACRGSLVTSESGDPCCPAKKPCSNDSAPSTPAPIRHASCGSCLCGGTTNPDETRVDFEIAQSVTSGALSLNLMADSVPLLSPPSFEPQGDNPGLIVPGAALRALFQSFLL